MKRIIALATAIIVLFALVLVTNVPAAWAHAEPEDCTPPIDGTVTTVPTEVVCTTGQAMDPEQSTLTVWNAAGEQVDAGDSQVDLNDPDRKTISVSLDTAKITDGVYTVKYATFSTDDNEAAEGEFTFTVNTGTAAATAEPTSDHAHATTTPEAASDHAMDASITVVSPEDGAEVPAGPLEIKVAVEGVTLDDEYHWHLYVDDSEVEMIMNGEDTFQIDISEGEHHIKVSLAGSDHGEIANTEIHVNAVAAAQAQGTPEPTAEPTTAPAAQPTEAPVTLPATGGEVNYGLVALLALFGLTLVGAGTLVATRARR